MNPLKIVGLGAGLAAIAGFAWWLYAKYNKKRKGPEIKPSAPPRGSTNPADDPTAPIPPEQTQPRGHYVTKPGLEPALAKALNGLFEESWRRSEAERTGIDPDDLIVFAAESEQTGNYTETRQELVQASVLSLDVGIVRARIIGPVEYAEHFGSHAGHGFRIGDLVEVPRSKVLGVTKPPVDERTGYGAKGKARATLKPSDSTKQVYRVKPSTPYDLLVPYRTKDLAWYVDNKLVRIEQIGKKGLLQQIAFTEDSMRGEVSVRALDEDSELGSIFVARWDFVLEA